MTTVSQVLKGKADNTIHTTTPSATVFEAVRLMAEKSIGALIVMEGEHVAGIITERDYARKIVLADRSSKATQVREIMTSRVLYVLPEETSQECMVLMTEHRIRHLPVMQDGKLIGLVSVGDLVKDVISEQQFTIQHLMHYISGGLGST